MVILSGGFTVPKALGFVCVSLGLAAGALMPAEFPQAEISNRSIHAKFYLPDAERGYYRGTRFEWSGIIYSLRYRGHEYFGPWFERHDPNIHDAITGPVEEFRTREAGLGYEEAKPGQTFIRIGVGVVRKPEERAYRPFNTYQMVNPGKWTVRQGRDWIEFAHQLADQTGFACVYRKKVRLVRNKPELVLEHSLKNTGRRPIETSQYNHNFFVMDGQPTGPDSVVKFPFPLRAAGDLKDMAQVRRDQLVVLRELKKGESVFTELEGFSRSAKDYDIRIENRKAGAGVRITGDRPLSKLYFWSIRTTLCPEPYIEMQIQPGRQFKWKVAYQFYTLPAPPAR